MLQILTLRDAQLCVCTVGHPEGLCPRDHSVIPKELRDHSVIPKELRDQVQTICHEGLCGERGRRFLATIL